MLYSFQFFTKKIYYMAIYTIILNEKFFLKKKLQFDAILYFPCNFMVVQRFSFKHCTANAFTRKHLWRHSKYIHGKLLSLHTHNVLLHSYILQEHSFYAKKLWHTYWDNFFLKIEIKIGIVHQKSGWYLSYAWLWSTHILLVIFNFE